MYSYRELKVQTLICLFYKRNPLMNIIVKFGEIFWWPRWKKSFWQQVWTDNDVKYSCHSTPWQRNTIHYLSYEECTRECAIKPNDVRMVEGTHSLGLLLEIDLQLRILDCLFQIYALHRVKSWGVDEFWSQEDMAVAAFAELTHWLVAVFLQDLLALFLTVASNHFLNLNF